MPSVHNTLAQRSKHSGPITWQSVPDFIQMALIAEGCTLLQQQRQQTQLPHPRFQYIPLSYQGHLYYLQKWSLHEWGVSPSQLLFPADGACPFEALNHGSLLSSRVKKAIANFYGHSPNNSPFHLPPKGYTSSNMLSLAR